jgi:hypothetical protein
VSNLKARFDGKEKKLQADTVGKLVADVEGNWLSHFDIGGKRYVPCCERHVCVCVCECALVFVQYIVCATL